MHATDRDLRRLACLQAMGITVYCSRQALPGAAPSRRVTLSPGVAPAARSPLPAPSRAAPAPAAPAPASARGGDPANAPAARSAPTPASRPAAAADAGERFTVAAIVAGNGLWLEELGGHPLAREQVALVRAMAQACRWPTTKPVVRQFAWPLHNNPQLDRGPGAAAAALEAFLRRLAQEGSCEHLLLLGTGAAERVGPGAAALPRLVLPSTRELLAEPARKRDAWETLRALATP
jgi:hypothetical protein